MALEVDEPSRQRDARDLMWTGLNSCVAIAALGTLASASGAGGRISLALVLAPVWLALGALWVGLAIAWVARPSRLRLLLTAPFLVLATVLLLAVHAPVRARFELSRSSFDALASTAPAYAVPTEGFPVHHRVGLYLISEGFTDRAGAGPRCLYYDQSPRFWGGAGGDFVRVPEGVDPVSCAGSDLVDLGGGWVTRPYDGF